LEDWGKITWAKQIVKKAKVIVSFIRQHHAPLAIFHQYETNLMLLNPTRTCFATNFLMVETLFKLKLAIEQTFANPDWITFVNSLCGNHHQKSLTKVKSFEPMQGRPSFMILVLTLYTWWNRS
jgi:hypothetical protein